MSLSNYQKMCLYGGITGLFLFCWNQTSLDEACGIIGVLSILFVVGMLIASAAEHFFPGKKVKNDDLKG